MPGNVEAFRPKLNHWAELLASGRADKFKEQELLPDFLTDLFGGLLGYTGPAGGGPRYTMSREKHVEVDGKCCRSRGGVAQPRSRGAEGER
jgi:hypothetical protein